MMNIYSAHSGRAGELRPSEQQSEIQWRPEWHGVISAIEAEERLAQRPPFTYILRGTDRWGEFYLSFVRPDLMVDHKYFVADNAKHEWVYPNGDTRRATSVQLLVPQIMHCQAHECLPLTS